VSEPLFLDANASVPPTPEALTAFSRVVGMRGNPSSPHQLGRALRRELDVARAAVAAAIGADEEGVVFTSGASEANRWWIDAVAPAKPVVWSSDLEHPSIAKPLAARGFRLGAVSEADVVVMTAAHNETGLRSDLDAVVERMPSDALLCVDASQAVGRVDFVVGRADVVTCSAHKMGGIPGAGALWLSKRARALRAPWAGGGQEGGRRPGTEPAALIAAFGAAAAVVERTRAEHAALAPHRDAIEAALLEAWAPAKVVGGGPRLPNTSAIAVEGVDGDALRMAIDRAGVCVGFGAACSALAPEPSPALVSLGLTPAEARAVVRISLSPGQGADTVAEAIARLSGALPRRR
jgi:cysteine desulfurase